MKVSQVARGRTRRDRRRDAAATREALLAAGAELFAERGYDGVPVWTIAAKAGVNKAMISYHFGGKRKLYRAIVDVTFSEIVSRVESLADAPRPAPDLLRELVANVADLATKRHPHFCTMMLREVLAGGKHLEPAAVAQPGRILAAVERIVERGVREGTLRRVDPLLTHLGLVGSLVFFFATARFRERVLAGGGLGVKPPSAAAYVRHIQDLITHGLMAHGADAGPTAGRTAWRAAAPLERSAHGASHRA
jgi:TetR/AcrR family transcriptional regulator